MAELRRRMRVLEYVCEGVLLARYLIVDGESLRVDPRPSWPRGTVGRSWLVGLEGQVEEFPVDLDEAGVPS